MNTKVSFGLLLISVLLIMGCVSEFNAELPSNDMQVLIVDGQIIENTDVRFYLSKSFPLNFISLPEENRIVDAKLTLIGSNGYQSAPATSLGAGSYLLPVGQLDDNVEYGIQIEYDGDIYQSTLLKPLHTPEIDSISWVQPYEYGDVFFRVSTHDDTEGAKFFLWSYTENWEVRADYYTTIFYSPSGDATDGTYYMIEPAPYYYCWRSNASFEFLIGSTASLNENKIINKQLFQKESSDSRFSMLYSVTVTQQAISNDAFEYYQNKILLNEEMGGLFTPQPFELGGNITCITDPSKRVMGYVETLKNTTQKRIFVSSEQIKSSRIYSNCVQLINEEVAIMLADNNITLDDYYRMGYSPAGDTDPMCYPNACPHAWARASCTDCRRNGGTKNKPYFWPNDHQ